MTNDDKTSRRQAALRSCKALLHFSSPASPPSRGGQPVRNHLLRFADAEPEALHRAVAHAASPAKARLGRGLSDSPNQGWAPSLHLRFSTRQLPALATSHLPLPHPSALPQEAMIGQLGSRAHPRASPRQEGLTLPPNGNAHPNPY